MGDASSRIDWDALVGKLAKYVGGFLALMLGVVTLPMLSPQSGLRLLVALVLAAAAVLAVLSGRSLRRRGDPTEGAARTLVGLLFAVAAVWFSNLIPTPTAIQAPTVAGRVNDAIRTVGGAEPRRGLDQNLSFTLYPGDGAASRLEAPLAQALRAEAAGRPLPDGARVTAAGVRLSVRAGSLAGGQVTATARVALAAQGAPECQFSVSTPRAMPLQAAADRLAQDIVDRAQTFVEGSDAC